MAKIFYRRILAGALTLAEVPERWREDARALLAEAGRSDLCGGEAEPETAAEP